MFVQHKLVRNDLVKLEVDGALAIISIDHPPVNALNAKVLDELSSILDYIDESTNLRAAILTGCGDKAFVAGADIKEFPDLTEETGKQLSLNGHVIFSRIENLKIPVICAITGFALGGGCELALACDIRIADSKAKFGLPEVGFGILPGYGGTQRLPRVIGLGKTKELIFSGEAVTAEEAYRIGLVEKMVPEGNALQTAKELANSIIARGPLAIKNAKIAINQGFDLPIQQGIELEAQLFGQLCNSEDKGEGVSAFFEKRKPHFKGK